jgi:hypothetical protein
MNTECKNTIPSITPTGQLTSGQIGYCSTRCKNVARDRALGRKLDLLRREAGLDVTGKAKVNHREVDALLQLIGRLRRVG